MCVVATGCGRIGFGLEHGGDAGDGDDDGATLGDGGTSTSALVGFWTMTTARIAGESTDRARSDLTAGIRADLLVDPGHTTSAVTYRYAALGAQIATMSDTETTNLTHASDDAWVFDNGTMPAGAFDATFSDPDHVALVQRVGDPRNLGTFPLERMSLARATPWNAAVVGSWTVSKVAPPGLGLLPTGVCSPSTSPNYEIPTGTATVTPSFGSALHIHEAYFTASDCLSGAVGTQDTDMTGYLEPSAGTFSTWLAVTANGTHFGDIADAGTLTPVGAGWRYTFTTCAPVATCMQIGTAIEYQ